MWVCSHGAVSTRQTQIWEPAWASPSSSHKTQSGWRETRKGQENMGQATLGSSHGFEQKEFRRCFFLLKLRQNAESSAWPGIGITFQLESESEVAQSCPTLCDPMKPTKLLRPWDFPGKSTGVGCHFLLQGLFLTQGSNPGFPHCGQMLYPRDLNLHFSDGAVENLEGELTQGIQLINHQEPTPVSRLPLSPCFASALLSIASLIQRCEILAIFRLGFGEIAPAI